MPQQDVVQNPFANAVVVSLTLRMPGNTRRISMDNIEVDADKAMLSLSMDLLDSPEYKAVGKKYAKIRGWLLKRSVPCDLVGDGNYILPMSILKSTDEGLLRLRREADELVTTCGEKYPERKADAKVRLNGHFDESAYPPVEEYLAGFGVYWRYKTVATPSAQLEAIAPEIRQRAESEAQQDLTDTLTEIRKKNAIDLKVCVDRFVVQLAPRESGKRGKVYESLVGNTVEYFEFFDAKDSVAPYPELAGLVSQAKAVLAGVTTELLKDNDRVRATVYQAMQDVKSRLDALAPRKATRVMVLEEAPEEVTV